MLYMFLFNSTKFAFVLFFYIDFAKTNSHIVNQYFNMSKLNFRVHSGVRIPEKNREWMVH